jgi:hypothetical protein
MPAMFKDFPAATPVEQAILLAQLHILRQIEAQRLRL